MRGGNCHLRPLARAPAVISPKLTTELAHSSAGASRAERSSAPPRKRCGNRRILRVRPGRGGGCASLARRASAGGRAVVGVRRAHRGRQGRPVAQRELHGLVCIPGTHARTACVNGAGWAVPEARSAPRRFRFTKNFRLSLALPGLRLRSLLTGVAHPHPFKAAGEGGTSQARPQPGVPARGSAIPRHLRTQFLRQRRPRGRRGAAKWRPAGRKGLAGTERGAGSGGGREAWPWHSSPEAPLAAWASPLAGRLGTCPSSGFAAPGPPRCPGARLWRLCPLK